MTNEEAIKRLIDINSRLLDAKLRLKRSRRRPSEKAMMLMSLDSDMTAIGIAVSALKAPEPEVTDEMLAAFSGPLRARRG